MTIGNPDFAEPVRPVHRHLRQPVQVEPRLRQAELAAGGNQLVDFSGNYRHEHETRDFGGQTSFESATDIKNSVYGATLRHQWNSNNALNQATLSWQNYAWNPTPLNPDLVGRNYRRASSASAATARPRSSTSAASSCATTTTSPSSSWQGDHNFQVGGNVDFMHYNVNKSLNGNPVYNFRNDPANGFTFAQPFEAQFGFGNPMLIDQQQRVRHLRPGHLDRQRRA